MASSEATSKQQQQHPKRRRLQNCSRDVARLVVAQETRNVEKGEDNSALWCHFAQATVTCARCSSRVRCSLVCWLD